MLDPDQRAPDQAGFTLVEASIATMLVIVFFLTFATAVNVAVGGVATDRAAGIATSLGVYRGEVVLEDAGWGCPAECSVGSVVIVEMHEPGVGAGPLGF